MSIVIVIPARYGSTRFPGKPLMKIAGETMISRVISVAKEASKDFENVSLLVATDDKRIKDHVDTLDVPCVMTPESCKTGSDRALAAVQTLDNKPDFVLNLQGDAPFTPPQALHKMIAAFRDKPDLQVITPVHRLSWDDLERLREAKKETPFSGTCAIISEDGRALWFSKNILPAVRKEEDMKEGEPMSPVHQHLGLYGFRTDILEKFCSLPQSTYEQLEGLEQLRLLENGITIDTVLLDVEAGTLQSGIDTPEDLARAEAMLAAQDLKARAG